jgi:hypothetical protein
MDMQEWSSRFAMSQYFAARLDFLPSQCTMAGVPNWPVLTMIRIRPLKLTAFKSYSQARQAQPAIKTVAVALALDTEKPADAAIRRALGKPGKGRSAA